MAIPPSFRLVVLFGLGTLLGSLLNLAIYRLAWYRRSISPWSTPPAQAEPRRWSDRIPVLGWFALRREAKLQGRGFWIRPLLIELGTGAGLAWLYYWEVLQRGLYDLPPAVEIPASHLHAQYFAHVVLVALMVAASFIDIDERLIPDSITVSGTLLGLVIAVVFPWSLLPQLTIQTASPRYAVALELPSALAERLGPGERLYAEFLTLVAPLEWPPALEGAPQRWSLLLGLGCYWLWCFALAPRPWYGRHGFRRGLSVCCARLLRSLRTWQMLILIASGTAGIAGVWGLAGARWAALLSMLVGLAASGGLIWAVRIIGAVTLRKEAMGFGDVLLMMMIGAFLGWQPGLFIFFLAPLAGLVMGVAQFLFWRDQTIPYGPFLCLAAVVTVVAWAPIWNWASDLMAIGWLVPTVVAVGLVAMALMLLVVHLVRQWAGAA